ncbi:MAG TPA: Ig-like domain-containing protein [Kofleriaceae bacterium]|nr:Ig-like domain-containing protein [Kofleriaceae bacterium]
MSVSRSYPVLVAAACAALAGCDEPQVDNQPPILEPILVSTKEDVPIEVNVLDDAVDRDGDSLTVIEAGSDGHEAELLPSGVIRVTPRADFVGVFQVRYKVTDGRNTAASFVMVTVRPVNDAPVAINGTQSVHRAAIVRLNGTDVDGDTLSYEIVTPPEHGTLTGDPPELHYTAEAGFDGMDEIVFRVRDGALASGLGTLQIEVNERAPQALADSFTGSEDQGSTLFLSATDPDFDPVTYTIEQLPQHGTLSGTAPNLQYTPEPDFHGTDSFTYSVSDGVFSSNTANVSLTVLPVNDPPVATGQAVSTSEDVPLMITLAGSDIDGDSLSFVVQQPAHGTLSAGSGAVHTYTPAPNFHGSDSFTFVVQDSLSVSSTPVTVTIDVASVEDPPVAGSFTRNLSEDASVSFSLQGSDADGDPIEYALGTLPAHGTLTGTPPDLTYTPNPDFNGQDAFTYTVSSGGVTSPAGTVTLQVGPVNDPPVASGSTVTTAEDTAVTFTLQASDVDNANLTYTITTIPSDGSVTGGTAAARTYTPAHNASGTRSLVFRACDTSNACSSATVTIEITPVNDPPTAVDDFVFTEAGTPVTFDVTSNDADPEADPFELTSTAVPAHGTAAVVDGQLVYTPDAGFIGTDVFAYTVVDASGAAATASAHVGVGTFPPGAPAETIATVGGALSTTQGVPPAISEDGRFIAFTTGLSLVTDDTNNFDDVYLYDRGTRTFTRASVSSTGGQGNGASRRPRLSADGRYVVFESFASNLVAGDSNARLDVFRHDRVTGETIRVSVATGDAQASGSSGVPDVSEDGNRVVFASTAFDLVAGDSNGSSDIFLRDIAAATTTRVSLGSAGGQGDQGSTSPVISGDGNHVAFVSTATNLVDVDNDGLADVFARDLLTATTTRVSVSSTGVEADRPALLPAVSRDGAVFAFLSNATNLVAVPAGTVQQVYIRDLAGPITIRPVTSGSAMVWARLSGDGRYVVEFGSSGVTLCDRIAPTTVVPPGAGSWFWPSLSGNGKYLVVLEAKQSSVVTVVPNPLNPL